MVLAVSGLGTAAGAAAPVFVNVAPRTGLVDYQHVTVAGSGFSPNVQVATVECRSGALAQGDCDLGTLVYRRTDAKGKFSFQRYVRRIISVGGTHVDCGRSAGCILGAGNVSNLKQASGPRRSSSTRTFRRRWRSSRSRRARVLADHELVTVAGSGFQPGGTVYISQCVSGSPTQPGPCSYSTQRYVKTNSQGAFTATNFPLERRQLAFTKGAQRRLDCADAPGRCDIRALNGGFASGTQPRVPLGFDPNKPPAVENAHLSPTTQFVDLQSVDVTGTGFTPGYSVNIVECAAPTANNLDSCDYTTAQTVTAGFHGELSTAFFMRRKLSGYTSTGPVVIDCAAKAGAGPAGTCTTTAAESTTPGASAAARSVVSSAKPSNPRSASSSGASASTPRP